MRGKREKGKSEMKTVKVKLETYAALIRTKGAYEMITGKNLSMDDVIKNLLEAAPKAKASLELVNEEST